MKNSNENPSLSCDEIEGWLVLRHFSEITKDQNLLVEEHLKSCDQCRSYQKTLSILQESMKIGTEERLTPHPAIRENVIRRMKTVKAQQLNIFESIWQSVKGVFEYRVPVYQTLFAVALIALIFLGVRQINLPAEREISSPEGVIHLQAPIFTEVSVINNLDIVKQQKIGRSVGEDITLTRFIVSSM